MLKYLMTYKHLKISNMHEDIILELNYDNMTGRAIYAAKSNALFIEDEFDDWGHAAGVGDSEKEALEMCLKEIKQYLRNTPDYDKVKEVKVQDLEQINMPCRFTLVKGNKDITYFYKIEGNELEILTKDKKVFAPLIKDDIALTFEKNFKKLDKSSYNNYSLGYLKQSNFFPTFDNLSYKYEKQNIENIQ